MNERVHRAGDLGEVAPDVDNRPAGASDPGPAGTLPLCSWPGCETPSLDLCDWHREFLEVESFYV